MSLLTSGYVNILGTEHFKGCFRMLFFPDLSFMLLSCISCSGVGLVHRIRARRDSVVVHVGCLMCDKSMVLWLTLHFPEERKRISSVQTKRAIHPEFSPVVYWSDETCPDSA
uniref:Uncharacterized protein n=1 Tax=Mus musculus TaxID=10090 RepID=Q8BR39_MOUSE|nr:unnamed protein product [Mus musculus]